MQLLQALCTCNESVVVEYILKGKHPRQYLELCIKSRVPADVLRFVLSFSHWKDVDDIREVQQHLEFLDRYPVALAVVTDWLAQKNA